MLKSSNLYLLKVLYGKIWLFNTFLHETSRFRLELMKSYSRDLKFNIYINPSRYCIGKRFTSVLYFDLFVSFYSSCCVVYRKVYKFTGTLLKKWKIYPVFIYICVCLDNCTLQSNISHYLSPPLVIYFYFCFMSLTC